MRKGILSLGFFLVMIIFVFQSTTYSQSNSINPFESFDKEYEKRLDIMKNDSADNLYSKRGQSNIETIDRSKKNFIVKFKNDAPMKDIFHIVNDYKYEILGKSEDRIFLLDLDQVENFKEKSKKILDHIEEDTTRESQSIPSDTYYFNQWALPAINIPKAWNISKGSNSVYVAVIDSGIARNHPDLANTDIRQGWDFIRNQVCLRDTNGHGTKVTGIIGATTNNGIGIAGINWDVAIIPLGVTVADGSAYTSDNIKAINAAAEIGSHVINISLTGSHYSYSEQLAISNASSKGSIVIASAGNNGSSEYLYPASYSNVISVGSVNQDLEVSRFSQYNNALDLVAPGENIITTYDSYYDFVDGTSFSAPHVSGVAALMLAVKPSINYYEFMEMIKHTSTDLGDPGYDNEYGYGLINAGKMLESISPNPSNSPKEGWIKNNYKYYYLNENGNTHKGWLKNQGQWYYLNTNDGAMETGWLFNRGKWYYLNRNGAMETGWLMDGGLWYYLNDSGAMETGWQWIGGKWYYLSPSGAMQTGWKFIGGKWYFLYKGGSMAANTSISGYRLGNNGAML